MIHNHFYQRTVAQKVECSGIGVHSGKKVNLTIKPAMINYGIKFVRIDLPDNPVIPAQFNKVVDTSLATVIGNDGFIVSTIEHLMACFAGLAIDNAMVEIDAYEVPIMDGSAREFTSSIISAGIKEQDAPRYYFVIKEPIELKKDEKFIGVYPCANYKITYTIDYPHPLIKRQFYSTDVTDRIFANEISKARTFGFLQEYEYLKRYGLARGCSLENVVVVDDDNVINPEGLRFRDEFVRHKILDCIGDFSLLGIPVLGHIVAKKSGHFFSHLFLKKFFAQKKSWETHTLFDLYELPQSQSKALAV